MINSKNSQNQFFRNNLDEKFLFLKSVSDLDKLKLNPEIELCIIQTDFSKSELSAIKSCKNKDKYKNIEIWISSTDLSREKILMANKIGIKTVICYPIDKKIIEEFFIKKGGVGIDEAKVNYAYSEISNCKVMIIDDNLMNIQLLEEILSEFNIDITSFLKPKEAYEQILKEKYDLFLLDVMMPEMSGFELAEKIKETPYNKNVPIVFISALSDSNNKIKGYNLGSFAYIEKPFDINIIKSQIFNILKNQKAQEILASNKETFLATVAHDLKTPISAGINALNLLLNENLGELEDDQQELVEDILNSTKFMKDMVDNILCKNKIERDNINLSKQIYSLEKLIKHCIELTKYILEPKNQIIVLECNLKNTLVPFDFLEMKRVVHNLIANSSEHSPNGSKIHIKLFETNNKMGFFIQDFGKGIDLEHQDDVFLQYMTLAKKNKRVGSGLGLFICKKIIEAHDGEITLESKIGQGTKITVQLPSYTKI